MVSGKIRNFKDLQVWQKADILVHQIYDCADFFPKKYSFVLTSQLRRAALSIPTNIAEGCASAHSKELIQFLNIALRSLSETHYLLLFAFKRNLINEDILKKFENDIEEINKMTGALIKSIRQKLTTH